jgi:hypothetical protein
MGIFGAKGRDASGLRRRKYRLVRQFGLPEDALGGSLSRTLRRCGKPNCHCATGKGHPIWFLTYRVDGQKHNEVIPAALVADLQPLVNDGCKLRNAVTELLSINAQLLRLWRQEQHRKRSLRGKTVTKPRRRRPSSKR